MAQNNDNWFGSWLSAAKNKSCEVLEFVKKDLEEFGNVVKTEATNVVTSTGTAIEKTLKLDEPESTASSMKRSFSSFLGQMNEALNPSLDDSDTDVIMIVKGNETVKLTKLQQALYELQKDELTFIQDPDPSMKKQYEYWLEIIDDQLSEDRLSKHMLSSLTLKNQYISLVPLKVGHELFWKRYLFRKALLEDDFARLEALEKRDSKLKEVTEDTVNWEEEDFSKDISLSEEEQIKLLEQYENETKEKEEQRKQSVDNKKDQVDEDVIFEANTNTTPTRKKETNKKSGGGKKKKQVEVVKGSPTSSSSSTDGDWEKISDTDK
ncbi:PREDICTED: BSD domain-containing protein 1-like isoform X1 [Nicrophorus vespilloides]|uniref:BSD domain-containing protein 1-like isoform X1 n=1 Tax=Nicrophorus vespilloides TaxID=110193 RepID=A0ABM1MYN0_NICVS|nr:PREDICTED: BSD domain-containing protein 1-like isoform X1 [Nicrophorus vespilloides]